MRALWRTKYKPTQAAQLFSSSRKRAHGPDRSQYPQKSARREENYRDSVIYNWKELEDEQEVTDEYKQYIHKKRVKFIKNQKRSPTWLLDYWRDCQMKWPNLTRMALDALLIPAMSAECERCFSSGKNMILDS
jgi:hypothetical protein